MDLPLYLVAVALVGLVLATGGCGTPHRAGDRLTPFGGEQGQVTPFLARADYSDRLGRVMRDVLVSHRFSIPWLVVRGTDGSLWFVAERLQSELRFDRINVNVTADERVAATITPYQYVASDWAILGRLVADFGPEAELIAREIASKLNEDKETSKP
jgi:hypothetical protein